MLSQKVLMDEIKLAEYDPLWQSLFLSEADTISDAL
jgi:hypothetical protein